MNEQLGASKLAANYFLTAANEILPDLQAIREDIHQHPELSYEEVRTATKCTDLMRSYGYVVRTGYAKTGLIADLGNDGPLIVIRADMDALPIQTVLQTPYASCEPNKMHACGHDAHVAMALGAARLLSRYRQLGHLPKGRVRFLFQPAEETADNENKTGAQRMIAEGALEGATAIIGQHGMPDIPLGKVAILDGAVMAASSPFEVIIRGNGGHIAEPHRIIDTILTACKIRLKARNWLIRNELSEQALIGFGTLEGDTHTFNVMPKQVIMRGTIRSFSDITQKLCKAVLHRICQSSCERTKAEHELHFKGNTPVTENDRAVARLMRQAAKNILGEEALITTQPRFTAEDFAWYKSVVPSTFMLIGTGKQNCPTQLHTANYDTPEEVLPIGAAILAESAVQLLSQK